MSHLPIELSQHRHIRAVPIILASLGVVIIALGFYMTGPRLVEFANVYKQWVCTKCSEEFRQIQNGMGVAKEQASGVSGSDGTVLTEATKAWLYTIPMKIIVAGMLLTLVGILTTYLGPLAVSGFRRTETALRDKVRDYFEAAISFIGKGSSRFFRLTATETGMWCFVLLIVLTISVPAIFWAPLGGLHVEGIDLQPAKNLVRHGIYGTLTTRGFDDLTHRSSAGPGIILVNALLFKVVGISAYASRALHVAFVLGNIVLVYLTARKLYGTKVALLTVYIFVPLVIFLSRGELPAGGEGYNPGFFYFLAGALLWFKGIETNKSIYLVICGVLWGFAFQAKWLFLFAVFALILTCVLLRFSKNGLGTKYWLVPISMVGLVTVAWVAFRIADLGLRPEIMHLRLFWDEHLHRAIGFTMEENSRPWEIFRPLRTLTQTGMSRIDLWGDLQFFLIIPAILYAIILLLKKGMSDYRSLLLLSFTLVWFSWWFFFNYDLGHVHLLVFVLVSQLFIAKFLVDVWEYSLAYKDNLLGLIKHSEDRKAIMSYLLRVAIVCIVLGKVFIPLIEKTGSLYSNGLTLTKPYKEMMTYVRANTETNAVFSGWDWSLPWYLDLDKERDHIIKDRATYPHDQRETVPEYFIVSPEWPLVKTTEEWPSVVPDVWWARQANEGRKKFVEQQCTFVKSFGGPQHAWLLYRVNSHALASESKGSRGAS